MSGRALIDKLPYDAEVEYLESDGINPMYIDLSEYVPFVADTNIAVDIVLKYKKSDVPYGCSFIYKGDITYDRIFTFQKGSNNYEYILRFFGSSAIILKSVFETKTHVHIDSTSLVVNNMYYTNTLVPFTGGYTDNTVFLLFTNSVTYPPQVAIYSFKLIKNNQTILDLIPVRKGNVGYMYDKVSGQLFGNNGTGSFILGNDI